MQELLKQNQCTVLKNYSKHVKDGNSVFTSLPPLKPYELFGKNKYLEFSANYVRIYGNDNEPKHHHISHVVGQIISGKGYLLTNQQKIQVQEGDVIIVPQGVKHEFICKEGKQMDYMAYEVADKSLDFKKHF